MKKGIFLSSIFTMLCSQASAKSFMVYGKRPESCGAWERARQQNSANYILAKNWLLGFITGTGYVASLTNVCLKDATSERLIAWIDDYCRNNPREEIASAARMLFLELLQTEES